MRRPHDVFPVFLKLTGKRVLIVGGGAMALEKLPALVEAGAIVKVVAPEILDEIRDYDVEIEQRSFVETDLDGVWYIVAAAPPEVNREVARGAERRCLFVNAVDDLESADVYLGSIVRRDGYTIAISSNARSPALTALLRRGLEVFWPQDFSEWLRLADTLRIDWKAQRIPFGKRRPMLLKAINAYYAREPRHAGEVPVAP